MAKSVLPKWQQEISSFRGIKSTFIIEGNINDLWDEKKMINVFCTE